MDTDTIQAFAQLSGSVTLQAFLLYAWWGERKERQEWQRTALKLARERSQLSTSPTSEQPLTVDE